MDGRVYPMSGTTTGEGVPCGAPDDVWGDGGSGDFWESDKGNADVADMVRDSTAADAASASARRGEEQNQERGAE